MRAAVVVPFLMIAFAAASTIIMLSDAGFRYVHRTPYTLGVPDASVMSVRHRIPKGETLGFVSDRDDLEAANRRLYGLTYSLAPLIVESKATHRFVVGDFEEPSSIPLALAHYRLHVAEDLGNGFLLLAAQ